MNKYEITFITQEENPSDPKDEITKLKGKINSEKSLGTRKFSYKIAGKESGLYQVIEFDMEPSQILNLNKKLLSNDKILRFIIIQKKAARLGPPAARQARFVPEEQAKTKEEQAKRIKPEPIPEKEIETIKKPRLSEKKVVKKAAEPEEKKAVKREVGKKEKAAKAKGEEVGVSDEKERLEKLDKKLDELLKE